MGGSTGKPLNVKVPLISNECTIAPKRGVWPVHRWPQCSQRQVTDEFSPRRLADEEPPL